MSTRRLQTPFFPVRHFRRPIHNMFKCIRATYSRLRSRSSSDDFCIYCLSMLQSHLTCQRSADSMLQYGRRASIGPVPACHETEYIFLLRHLASFGCMLEVMLWSFLIALTASYPSWRTYSYHFFVCKHCRPLISLHMLAFRRQRVRKLPRTCGKV